jgi:hypothetical protein
MSVLSSVQTGLKNLKCCIEKVVHRELPHEERFQTVGVIDGHGHNRRWRHSNEQRIVFSPWGLSPERALHLEACI